MDLKQSPSVEDIAYVIERIATAAYPNADSVTAAITELIEGGYCSISGHNVPSQIYIYNKTDAVRDAIYDILYALDNVVVLPTHINEKGTWYHVLVCVPTTG